jgi:hypothetical protein
VLAVIAVLGAAAVAVVVAWPSASIRVDAAGLPSVRTPRLAGTLEQVTLRSADGTPMPAVMSRDGTLEADAPGRGGNGTRGGGGRPPPRVDRLLAGHTETARLLVTAPTVHLSTRWLREARHARPGDVRPAGQGGQVTSDRQAENRAAGAAHPDRHPRQARYRGPRSGSAPSRSAGAAPAADGGHLVPTREGGDDACLARTRRDIGPATPLTLRFLGARRAPCTAACPPSRRTSRSWRQADAQTLRFRPRGYGYGLDSRVTLKLPAPVLVMAARAGR